MRPRRVRPSTFWTCGRRAIARPAPSPTCSTSCASWAGRTRPASSNALPAVPGCEGASPKQKRNKQIRIPQQQKTPNERACDTAVETITQQKQMNKPTTTNKTPTDERCLNIYCRVGVRFANVIFHEKTADFLSVCASVSVCACAAIYSRLIAIFVCVTNETCSVYSVFSYAFETAKRMQLFFSFGARTTSTLTLSYYENNHKKTATDCRVTLCPLFVSSGSPSVRVCNVYRSFLP